MPIYTHHHSVLVCNTFFMFVQSVEFVQNLFHNLCIAYRPAKLTVCILHNTYTTIILWDLCDNIGLVDASLSAAMSLHHLAVMAKPSLSCLLCFLNLGSKHLYFTTPSCVLLPNLYGYGCKAGSNIFPCIEVSDTKLIEDKAKFLNTLVHQFVERIPCQNIHLLAKIHRGQYGTHAWV